MSGITVVTKPADEPLGLTEVKDFLRLDDQIDDSFVRAFIIAAREFAENYTGKAFITRTVKFSIDGISEVDSGLWEGMKTGPYMTYYNDYIELPVAPAIAVSSIVYYDDADNQSTWPTTAYYADTVREPARIVLRDGQSFPTNLRKANGMEITYTAGYGSNPTDVPEAIRVAMLQYIVHMYEHRGDDEGKAVEFPPLIRSLLQPYKTMRYGDSPYMATYKSGIA